MQTKTRQLLRGKKCGGDQTVTTPVSNLTQTALPVITKFFEVSSAGSAPDQSPQFQLFSPVKVQASQSGCHLLATYEIVKNSDFEPARQTNSGVKIPKAADTSCRLKHKNNVNKECRRRGKKTGTGRQQVTSSKRTPEANLGCSSIRITNIGQTDVTGKGHTRETTAESTQITGPGRAQVTGPVGTQLTGSRRIRMTSTGRTIATNTGSIQFTETGYRNEKGITSNTFTASINSTGIKQRYDTDKRTTDGIGAEITDDTGAETRDDTGDETTNDTGAETTDDTGAETTDDTGAETTDDTGAETTDDTGAETTDDTGAETTDDTGEETTDDTGEGSSEDSDTDNQTDTEDTESTDGRPTATKSSEPPQDYLQSSSLSMVPSETPQQKRHSMEIWLQTVFPPMHGNDVSANAHKTSRHWSLEREEKSLNPDTHKTKNSFNERNNDNVDIQKHRYRLLDNGHVRRELDNADRSHVHEIKAGPRTSPHRQRSRSRSRKEAEVQVHESTEKRQHHDRGQKERARSQNLSVHQPNPEMYQEAKCNGRRHETPEHHHHHHGSKSRHENRKRKRREGTNTLSDPYDLHSPEGHTDSDKSKRRRVHRQTRPSRCRKFHQNANQKRSRENNDICCIT